MSRYKILSVYREMKEQPSKTFIASDFKLHGGRNISREILKTLKGLGLIEQVPAIYLFGKRKESKREVQGYKLKRGTCEPEILVK